MFCAMEERIRMPLSIYILFHLDYKEGLNIYTKMYHLLCRNPERPLTDGIDIPVYLRTGGNGRQIPEISFEQSKKTALFLLIDEHMYCSHTWEKYIEYLTNASNDNVKIYPVVLFKYGFEINPRINMNQFIKLTSYSLLDDCNWIEFQKRIYDDLIRLLVNKGTEKLKLFISHSKKDHDKIGEIKAKELRDFLRTDTKLDSFFDANDIVDGYDFENQIISNIGNSLLIILETNTYSEREWCRIEALAGKKNKIPCVVVNLINGLVRRHFPYLGNTPLIKFNDNWNDIINILLRSALNQYYQEQLLAEIKNKVNSNLTTLPFSPELLSYCLIKGAETVLYPEPPLGSEEINFLKLYYENITFITPMQAFSELSKNLRNKKIAISISESDDMHEYGGELALIRDITVEISRHILISGGKLVYGGDLRTQGFTELFMDLSNQYGQLEKTDRNTKYFTNYFAWPISLNLTPSHETEFKHNRISPITVPAPEECPFDQRETFLPPTTKESLFIWAKSLTKMRNQMESETDARIILGGRTNGFKGKYAGIVEEFIISKEYNHPIYLLGGFGGASKVIVDMIESDNNSSCLYKQAQTDPSYSEFIKYYNSQNSNETIDYEVVTSKIKTYSFNGLNNGLTEKENKILFHSTNILEIVALILKGLNIKLQ
jgi:hypothetical protein